MSTRALVLLASSTSLALLVGCGGAQEPGRYETSAEIAMGAPSQQTYGGPAPTAAVGSLGTSSGTEYSFDDDTVEGDLVRPDGEMAMSRRGGGESAGAYAPPPSPPPASSPSPASPSVSVESVEASVAEVSRSDRRSRRSSRRAARRREAERSRGADRAPAASVSVDEAAPIAVDGTVSLSAPIEEVPPPPPVYNPAPVVVQLTAASVGDVDRRGPYLDYLSRHPAEATQINLDMSRRVRFRVLDQRSRPVTDAAISFNTGGARVEGRTHADGYWDFFPGVSAPQAVGPTQVTIQWGNQQARTTINIPGAGDAQDVVIQLPQAVAPSPTTLDLAFLIDVTGSMGDELAYVNAEVQGIVERIRQANNQVSIRVAATFYRDRGDVYPLQQIDFTNDVGAFNAQMSRIRAGGGGDYPEDVNAGLEAAITRLSWSQGQAVRALVLIADAPPQNYPDEQYTYHHALLDAARRGIRIVPVAASGADRVVEYLFRAMGAFTSTPYIYLTDDSGIGGHHMEADTDRISVEMFSDVLTRMLISDLQGLGMHEPSHAEQGSMLLGYAQ